MLNTGPNRPKPALHCACRFHDVCLFLVCVGYPTKTRFLVEYGLYITILQFINFKEIHIFLMFCHDRLNSLKSGKNGNTEVKQ